MVVIGPPRGHNSQTSYSTGVPCVLIVPTRGHNWVWSVGDDPETPVVIIPTRGHNIIGYGTVSVSIGVLIAPARGYNVHRWSWAESRIHVLIDPARGNNGKSDLGHPTNSVILIALPRDHNIAASRSRPFSRSSSSPCGGAQQLLFEPGGARSVVLSTPARGHNGQRPPMWATHAGVLIDLPRGPNNRRTPH
ncbi:hypothetical protein [Streptomyces sp. NBC_00847]|uniref:hypothetical protein n=1 Tax=Streptomyces sp. NBC_00847 TaxID=2975850 RepID=UPI002259F7ED|nr:hypothetical protein [Streptomyces sp. NBC_00847]MCX4884653.1 hypothetical protein [Streptomyces sp. NBC_00847]